MRAIYFLLLVSVMTELIFCQTPIPPSSGSGTQSEPYLISSIGNLAWIAASNTAVPSPDQSARWSSHYLQTDDIDASSTSGWYSGAGWIPIGSTSIPFTGSYDGGGFSISGLYIYRPGYNNVGLFGYFSGSVNDLSIISCTMFGRNYAGAIAGYMINSAIVSKCSSSGSVEGVGLYAGGISGMMNNSCSIQDSFSECSVTGDDYVGGITGKNTVSEVTGCYATGNVFGRDYIGGLIGYSNGNVSNCYARGNTYGNAYVAGLIGYVNSYPVSYCYSTGQPSGVSKGGLIANIVSSSADYCYWDKETSMTTVSAGGTGYTTYQMKLQSSFQTWNFSTPVWKIVGGATYPYLAWQASAYITIVNSLNGVSGEYPVGEVIHLLPDLPPPGSGTAFLNWIDDLDTILSYEPEFDYVVTARNATVKANFVDDNYDLNLRITYSGGIVTLEWDQIFGAVSYTVYSTEDPYGTYNLDDTGTFNDTSWTAPSSSAKKFYFVVASDGSKGPKK